MIHASIFQNTESFAAGANFMKTLSTSVFSRAQKSHKFQVSLDWFQVSLSNSFLTLTGSKLAFKGSNLAFQNFVRA